MNLSKNALEVLQFRYLQNGESPEQMIKRVAEQIATVEDEKDHVYWLNKYIEIMEDLRFVPNTPTLVNAGRTGQLSACFVLEIQDSIDSIFETLKKAATIHKSGGGTGFDFSQLRPADSFVNGSGGVASGPVSFMRIYNAATAEMKQGGVRRGANMGILRVDHPDILDFIKCKRTEGILENFNISVAITEDFLQAVIEDGYYVLHHNGLSQKQILARPVMNEICKSIWINGEPGIIFIDRINQMNQLKAIESIASTNPCIVGETKVQTTEGNIPIKDLVGREDVDVYCRSIEGKLSIARAKHISLTKREADLVLVETTRGSIKCTPDHLFFTKNHGWIEAKQLIPSDRIVGLNRAMKNERYVGVGLTGYDKSDYILEHRFIHGHYENIEGLNVHHKDNDPLNNVRSNLESISHSDHSKATNQGHENWMEGHTDEKGRYTKKDIKKSKADRALNTGRQIGTNLRVVSVTGVKEKADVYDLSVPGHNNFIANGIVIHNCGEQPLPSNGSCSLGHLNLARYWNVHDEYFNWEALKNDIYTSVQFLDNMIEINNYPTEDIALEAKYTRRIGLGPMGLADLLLMARHTYGSEKSITFIEKVMNYFQKQAHLASYSLGVIRGTYQAYNEDPENLPNRRNGLVTTVAPTGSCSIIANCSPGIEPIFKFKFEKKVLDDDTKIEIYHPMAEHYYKNLEPLPDHFITAAEVSPVEHLRMQAAIQKYTDSGISKTVNVSNDLSIEGIYELIMLADKLQLKSLTIYREGSRNEEAQTEIRPDRIYEVNKDNSGTSGNSLKAETETETSGQKSTNLQYHVTPFRRKSRLEGFTWKIQTGRGKLYVTINEDDQGLPVEIFAKIGKSGKEDFAYTEAIGRLISLALRSGVPIDKIHYHLEGITGYDSKWDYKQLIKSVPDAIAKIIDMEYHILEHSKPVIDFDEPAIYQGFSSKLHTKEIDKHKGIHHSDNSCPECNSQMGYIEGCLKCFVCGFNKCGG